MGKEKWCQGQFESRAGRRPKLSLTPFFRFQALPEKTLDRPVSVRRPGRPRRAETEAEREGI